MSEYIFQEETLKTLADAFRYKLRNTEGMTVEDMQKLVYLMHYDIDNGVTLYDNDNNPVYSYSIAEANSLEELPDAPPVVGYIFANWSHTIDEVNATTVPMTVSPLYDRLATLVQVFTQEENQTMRLTISNQSAGKITIDWGDGTVEEVNTTASFTAFSHTYLNAAIYDAKIFSEDIGLQIKCTGKVFKVEHGKHITSIPDLAFIYCTELNSIHIPDSVTSIGREAFRNCTNAFVIEIPDSVTQIGAGAFDSCENLSSISIPKSVGKLKGVSTYGPFYGCKNLTSITISRIDDPTVSVLNGSHLFGSLFGGSSYDGSVNVQQRLGNNFYQYYLPQNLHSVTVLGGKLCTSAFRGCTTLRYIYIGDDVTLWDDGEYMFEGCTNLTEVTIGKGITKIGGYAFLNCSCRVTLPHTITEIAGGAFKNYTGEIIFQGTRSQWNSISKEKYWNYNSSMTISCIDDVS